MTYTKEAIEALDPLVRTLMEALGWDWSGGDGVPSADECLTDVAEAIRVRFMLIPLAAGEPSDAQVLAAVDAFMASQAQSEDGPILVHKNMAAALRAAGGAGCR